MNQYVVFWLAVLVVAIIVEVITMGLTSIWFAGGALLAAIVAIVGGPLWLQAVIFVLSSLVLIGVTRPLAARYFNKNLEKTNAESIIGKKAVVISAIDNLKGVGQVNVAGQEWTARTVEAGRVIPEGAVVAVLEIQGVKLIVRLDESMKDVVPEIRSDAELDPRYMEEQAAPVPEPEKRD
jgi:membrane protein implicated in regulation of membrane protease activity